MALKGSAYNPLGKKVEIDELNVLTTKGDLLSFSTDETRLPAGANKAVLTADNTEASGLKWDTNVGYVPIGGIIPWAKSMTGVPSLPSNFKECDGSTINDADSPMNGQAVPNLNGENRFLRGNSTSGGTGGSATHTLTVNEIPAHTHTIPRASDYGGSGNQFQQAGTYQNTLNTGSTGGGAAHNNEPQYYNVVWIMRIK